MFLTGWKYQIKNVDPCCKKIFFVDDLDDSKVFILKNNKSERSIEKPNQESLLPLDKMIKKSIAIPLYHQ